MKKGLVNMEYAKLGNTDIEVSKLCVGCMSFGKPGTMHDWTLDETRTEEIVKHALKCYNKVVTEVANKIY